MIWQGTLKNFVKTHNSLHTLVSVMDLLSNIITSTSECNEILKFSLIDFKLLNMNVTTVCYPRE